MIIHSTYIIFLHKQLEFVKCELWEVESPKNSKGLIFNIYLKTEKYLICYFCYLNSTIDLDVNPVGLDSTFHELSKYIKFVKFGRVVLEKIKFEVGTSL